MSHTRAGLGLVLRAEKKQGVGSRPHARDTPWLVLVWFFRAGKGHKGLVSCMVLVSSLE